ncbi:transposase zinc-binding domain-containing protein [Pseudobacteroides cellulosolvens]|uniref:transposase zinc-binding domain-containing protein n=1 Tax=Pseudobacteroides cellulosolvens TaxID=35825 RepID=UPI0009E1DEBA
MINPVQKTIAAMMLTFKMILCLNDNWETYLKKCIFTVREVERREVEKMLSCMGHSVYMCCDCGEAKILPHSCKSRICTVCGKNMPTSGLKK